MRKTAPNDAPLTPPDTCLLPSGRKEGKQQNGWVLNWENPLLGETSVTHRHLGQAGRAGAQRRRLAPASEGSDAAPRLSAN